METKSKYVVGYCRVSTKMQAEEGISIEAQEAAILSFAKYKKLPVLGIYIDAGISGGGEINDRKELERMLSELKRNTIVVIHSISRLARNTVTFLTIVKQIQEKGSEVFDLERQIDTGTSTGMLLLTFLGAVAEHEKVEIASRVGAAVNEKRKTGEIRFKPPYGMKFIGKRKPYEPIKEEQDAVLFIRKHLKMNGGGVNYTKICRLLTQEDFPSPGKSSEWRPARVKQLLIDYDIMDSNGLYIDKFDMTKDEKKMEDDHYKLVFRVSMKGMRKQDIDKYGKMTGEMYKQFKDNLAVEELKKCESSKCVTIDEKSTVEISKKEVDVDSLKDISDNVSNTDKKKNIKKIDEKAVDKKEQVTIQVDDKKLSPASTVQPSVPSYPQQPVGYPGYPPPVGYSGYTQPPPVTSYPQAPAGYPGYPPPASYPGYPPPPTGYPGYPQPPAGYPGYPPPPSGYPNYPPQPAGYPGYPPQPAGYQSDSNQQFFYPYYPYPMYPGHVQQPYTPPQDPAHPAHPAQSDIEKTKSDSATHIEQRKKKDKKHKRK